jgi:hypothetical protein
MIRIRFIFLPQNPNCSIRIALGFGMAEEWHTYRHLTYTHAISDLGLRISEIIDYQHIPQSAIPNPKSVVYIIWIQRTLSVFSVDLVRFKPLLSKSADVSLSFAASAAQNSRKFIMFIFDSSKINDLNDATKLQQKRILRKCKIDFK